jgi:uncharacterized membrane protein
VGTSGDELQELRRLVGELTARVFRIERALNLPSGIAAEAQRPQPSAPPPSQPPELKTAAPAMPSTPPRPAPVSSGKRSSGDLESRIGSHWLNRIGIAAVLIGVSYFLKFAFDNNWIGPAGRVAIGLLAGIAIVVWSEKFRHRGYVIFSYSLKAVGIGVLYLSLYAAFQVYSLIPGSVAFTMMFVVTATTALMAWTQDAEILAAFALVGGFATPLLLSTGQNREVALFTYVVLLDAGALALVVLKPWRRLLLLSYAGTLLLYVGWYASFYDVTQVRMTVGFATLFFAIFAVAPLLARPAQKGWLSDSVPPLVAVVNAAGYFLQIYVMFEEIGTKDTAWFALALAALYIFLSRQARGRAGSPEAARIVDLLHLALAIGFITVAIPIRLDAHWITMGWFVEVAVLLWVADRIHSDLLNVFAIGALVLGVGRLLLIDNFYVTRPIFNTRMATYAVAIAVLGAVAWYGDRRKHEEAARTVAGVAVVALNLLALIALSREVADYYTREMTSLRPQGQWNPSEWADWHHLKIARDFTYSALWMAYGAMLMVVGFWRRSAFVRWQALVLIAFTIGKVFLYDVSELDRGYRIVSFIVLGVLLLAISFMYQRDWLKLSSRNDSKESPAGT